MSTAPDAPTPEAPAPEDAGVRNYTFLCLVALLVVLLALLVMLPRWGPMWVLLPVLVGLASLLLRWRAGPLVFLTVLGGVLYIASALRAPLRPGALVPAPPSVMDLLLAGAVLAYVAGHYRLQALVKFLFPRDPRRAATGAGPPRVRRPPTRVPEQRSRGLASPGELVWLLLALPSWALLAVIAYRLLVPNEPLDFFGENPGYASSEWPEYEARLSVGVLAELLWRGRALLWVLGVGVLFVSGVLSYLAWNPKRRAEAEVFLQDTAWRETRREQRRINSWLVWARLRRGRGKEGP
jgi:hypothetical protein